MKAVADTYTCADEPVERKPASVHSPTPSRGTFRSDARVGNRVSLPDASSRAARIASRAVASASFEASSSYGSGQHGVYRVASKGGWKGRMEEEEEQREERERERGKRGLFRRRVLPTTEAPFS